MPDESDGFLEIEAAQAGGHIIPRLMGAEYRWFRKIMLLFYIATFIVVVDIYFGKFLNAQLALFFDPPLQKLLLRFS
jgi:hypothetical protein